MSICKLNTWIQDFVPGDALAQVEMVEATGRLQQQFHVDNSDASLMVHYQLQYYYATN